METRAAKTDPAELVRRWVIPGESRVYVLTFGCQQNEADSERLLAVSRTKRTANGCSDWRSRSGTGAPIRPKKPN